MTKLANGIADVFAKIDMRAWFTIGIFFLVWKVLDMIDADKSLLESAPFMQFVGPIGGAGGLLLIASFFFGSNKESGEKSAALRDNAATLRDAGITVGGRRAEDPSAHQPTPAPTVSVNPDYATKTDDELRQLLLERERDTPEAVAAMDRSALLIRLAELDAPGSDEVKP